MDGNEASIDASEIMDTTSNEGSVTVAAETTSSAAAAATVRDLLGVLDDVMDIDLSAGASDPNAHQMPYVR